MSAARRRKPVSASAVKKSAVSPKKKPPDGSLGFLSMGRGTLPCGSTLSVQR